MPTSTESCNWLAANGFAGRHFLACGHIVRVRDYDRALGCASNCFGPRLPQRHTRTALLRSVLSGQRHFHLWCTECTGIITVEAFAMFEAYSGGQLLGLSSYLTHPGPAQTARNSRFEPLRARMALTNTLPSYPTYIFNIPGREDADRHRFGQEVLAKIYQVEHLNWPVRFVTLSAVDLEIQRRLGREGRLQEANWGMGMLLALVNAGVVSPGVDGPRGTQ